MARRLVSVGAFTRDAVLAVPRQAGRTHARNGPGPVVERTAVKLSAARIKARQHAAVREGRDLLAERRAENAKAEGDAAKAQVAGMSFADVADIYPSNSHEAGWRSSKHRLNWRALSPSPPRA
jgi:hypothetical protein